MQSTLFHKAEQSSHQEGGEMDVTRQSNHDNYVKYNISRVGIAAR